MAARAYWQGQIRLALVSIPVEIYSASKTGREDQLQPDPRAQRQAHLLRKSRRGHRPGRPRRDHQGLRDIQGRIRPARRRGDRGGQDREQEDARTGPVRRRVRDRPALFRKALLRRAQGRSGGGGLRRAARSLRKAKKVALGQLSVRGSEKLVAIKPCGKGLLLETLRYADEVRKGQAFFDGYRRWQAQEGAARSRHHADRAEEARPSMPANSRIAMPTR